MSRALLEKLNGGVPGVFAEWLQNHRWEPRIAWYPSCGHDFKDLLYLHSSHTRRRFDGMPEPPEIFIHTDCSIGLLEPLGQLRTLRQKFRHRDEWTTVSVVGEQELPKLNATPMACDAGYSQFPASGDYGRVFFLLLHIESDRLGSILQPAIYAVVENGAFASEVLLKTKARITHVWNVRPGGHPNPWIGYLLRRLGTECLVRDDEFYGGEELAYQRQEYFNYFPNLEGSAEDDPDPSKWQLRGPLASEDNPRPLNCYTINLSKRKRHKKILDELYEKSSSWNWLKSKAGAYFISSNFNRQGIHQIHFRRAKSEVNIIKNLHVNRREVSKKVAEAFAIARGDTQFQLMKTHEFESCLNWRSFEDYERMTFGEPYRSSWIMSLFWDEPGLSSIFFLKNSNCAVEHDFLHREAVLNVLQGFLRPFAQP
jgi:hypothetical protein